MYSTPVPDSSVWHPEGNLKSFRLLRFSWTHRMLVALFGILKLTVQSLGSSWSCSGYWVFDNKVRSIHFDYSWDLTCEAPWPLGDTNINWPTLVGNSRSIGGVCLCAVHSCLSWKLQSELASTVTMVILYRGGPAQWKSSWSLGKIEDALALSQELEMRYCQNQILTNWEKETSLMLAYA